MHSVTLGTSAKAAQVLAGILAVSSPTTASEFPRASEHYVRPTQKVTSRTSFDPIISSATSVIANEGRYSDVAESAVQLERLTTQQEKLIGEIRSWGLLDSDWDGEGALAPSDQSIKEAVLFTRLLNDISLPEPMLLASGHIALYKNDSDLYADIEFLGDGRIAYFIKRNGDKHKGVLKFDSQKLPAVFADFLVAKLIAKA
jgi:hypothetical protein